MKNIMYLVVEANVGQTLFLAPFANESKNDITSPETHNRMPTLDRIVNE